MKNVLIVEDDFASRLALELSLREQFNVVSLSELSDIDALFDKQHIDIVLMDIHLRESEVDGVQIMNFLKKKYPESKTSYIAVTGYAMPNDKERFLEHGFDGYLAKPVDFPTLPAYLANIQPL